MRGRTQSIQQPGGGQRESADTDRRDPRPTFHSSAQCPENILRVRRRGLRSYNWIGAGWLLHTGWDVLHHLYGNPIVPFAADSSFGCAICDPVIALWCFAGAPSVYDLLRRRKLEEPNPAP